MLQKCRGGLQVKRADLADQAFGRRGCNSRPFVSESTAGVGHGSRTSRRRSRPCSPAMNAGVAYLTSFVGRCTRVKWPPTRMPRTSMKVSKPRAHATRSACTSECSPPRAFRIT